MIAIEKLEINFEKTEIAIKKLKILQGLQDKKMGLYYLES